MRRVLSPLVAAAWALASCGGPAPEAPSAAPGAEPVTPVAPELASPGAQAPLPHDVRSLFAAAGSAVRTRSDSALAELERNGLESVRDAERALLDLSPAVADGAARHLARACDAAAVPAVLAALPSAPSARAERLVEALGTSRAPAATAALLDAVTTRKDRVAMIAAETLSRSQVPFDHARLRATAGPDAHPVARQAALVAIGGAPEADDVGVLRAAAADPSAPVRACAVRGLFRSAAVGRADAEPIFSDSEDAVRECAVREADALRADWAVELLSGAALADASSEVRQGALQALGRRGPAAFATLLEAARNDREKSDLRGAAFRALAAVDGDRARAELSRESVLFDETTRLLYADALEAKPR